MFGCASRLPWNHRVTSARWKRTCVTPCGSNRPRLLRGAALGGISLKKGDLEAAARQLATARSHGTHPNVLMLDAQLAAARGDAVRSFVLFDRLLQETGAVPRIHYLYAQAAHRPGDHAVATREAKACVALDAGATPCRELLRELGEP